MSELVFKPAADVNRSMVKFLPELSSEYAKYPMKHDRWYDPNEVAPQGEPCYLGGSDDVGVKKDYVYCRKVPQGMKAGYFSIMCNVSYVNLYEKLDSVRPETKCCGMAGDTEGADQWDDVKRVVWGRQLAAKPDDVVAGKAAMEKARGNANSVYLWTQNEQLVVNAAATGAFIATH